MHRPSIPLTHPALGRNQSLYVSVPMFWFAMIRLTGRTSDYKPLTAKGSRLKKRLVFNIVIDPSRGNENTRYWILGSDKPGAIGRISSLSNMTLLASEAFSDRLRVNLLLNRPSISNHVHVRCANLIRSRTPKPQRSQILHCHSVYSSYTRKSSRPVHLFASSIPLSLGVLNATRPRLSPEQSIPNINPAAHSSNNALHHPFLRSAMHVHIREMPITALCLMPLVSTHFASGIRQHANVMCSAATREITRD